MNIFVMNLIQKILVMRAEIYFKMCSVYTYLEFLFSTIGVPFSDSSYLDKLTRPASYKEYKPLFAKINL